MKNGGEVFMMQQLTFSPVENILTVLFAAAILGYLLYLLCGAYGTGNGDIVR